MQEAFGSTTGDDDSSLNGDHAGGGGSGGFLTLTNKCQTNLKSRFIPNQPIKIERGSHLQLLGGAIQNDYGHDLWSYTALDEKVRQAEMDKAKTKFLSPPVKKMTNPFSRFLTPNSVAQRHNSMENIMLMSNKNQGEIRYRMAPKSPYYGAISRTIAPTTITTPQPSRKIDLQQIVRKNELGKSRNKLEKSAQEKAQDWYEEFLKLNFNEGPRATATSAKPNQRIKMALKNGKGRISQREVPPTSRPGNTMTLDMGKGSLATALVPGSSPLNKLVRKDVITSKQPPTKPQSALLTQTQTPTQIQVHTKVKSHVHHAQVCNEAQAQTKSQAKAHVHHEAQAQTHGNNPPTEGKHHSSKNDNNSIRNDSDEGLELLCLVKPKKMTFSETTIGIPIIPSNDQTKMSQTNQEENKNNQISNETTLKSDQKPSTNDPSEKLNEVVTVPGNPASNSSKKIEAEGEGEVVFATPQSTESSLERTQESLLVLKKRPGSGSSILEASINSTQLYAEASHSEPEEGNLVSKPPLDKKEIERQQREAAEAEVKAAALARQKRILERKENGGENGDKEEWISGDESYQLSKSFSSYSVDSDWVMRDKINTAVKESPKTIPIPVKPKPPPSPTSAKKRIFQRRKGQRLVNRVNPNIKYSDPKEYSQEESHNSSRKLNEEKKKKVTFGSNQNVPKVGFSSQVRLANTNTSLKASGSAGNSGSATSMLGKEELTRKSSVIKSNGKIVVKDMHRKGDLSYIDDSYDTFYYKYYKPELRRTIIVCKYRHLPKSKKPKPPNTLTEEGSLLEGALQNSPQSPTTSPSTALQSALSSKSLTSQQWNATNFQSTTSIDRKSTSKTKSRSSSISSDKKLLQSDSKSSPEVAYPYLEKEYLREKKKRLKSVLSDVEKSATKVNTQIGVNFCMFSPIGYQQCELSSLLSSNYPDPVYALDEPIAHSPDSLKAKKKSKKLRSKKRGSTKVSTGKDPKNKAAKPKRTTKKSASAASAKSSKKNNKTGKKTTTTITTTNLTKSKTNLTSKISNKKQHLSTGNKKKPTTAKKISHKTK